MATSSIKRKIRKKRKKVVKQDTLIPTARKQKTIAISKVILTGYGLSVSKSDVANLLKSAAKYLGKHYEELKKAVRRGRVIDMFPNKVLCFTGEWVLFWGIFMWRLVDGSSRDLLRGG